MNYDILWHEDALNDLKRIEKKEAERVIEKVETHLIRNPHALGKPLSGHLRGFFRYRVGKYRVIYTIKNNELLIMVLKIGKRDKVYKTK